MHFVIEKEVRKVSVDSKDRPFRVVWPLMISQTIGAFNDNAMKRDAAADGSGTIR